MKTFFLFISIIVFTSAIYGQGPNAINVYLCDSEGRVAAANGTYTKGVDVNGCDCYDKDGETGRIVYVATGLTSFQYEAGKNCSDGDMIGSSDEIQTNSNCRNILDPNANWRGTCVFEALSDPPSTPIPTLSQWALVILGTSLLIVGVIFSKERKTSSIF